MARASTVAWLGITVGLALQPTSLRAQTPAPKETTEISATVQTPSSGVHVTLRTAMDCYRRGDYELAASLLQQAQAGSQSLSADERKDMANWQTLNDAALQNRRTGASQLQQADLAAKQGKTQNAIALLKQVTPNQQYLTQADKLKMQQLTEQLMPGSTPQNSVVAGSPALAQARSKLKQARGLMARGNYDAAMAMAKEADNLHAAYAPGEDTPSRVMSDISASRSKTLVIPSDAKACLAAARTAMAKGELENAEILAREAQKHTSGWSSMTSFMSDTPAKVLKDIEAAKLKQATAKSYTSIKPGVSQTSVEVNASAKPVAQSNSSLIGAEATPINVQASAEIKAPTAAQPTSTTKQMSASVPASSTTAPATNEATARARDLLKEARKAMQAGKMEQAKTYVAQAQALKPQLDWREDSPERILAEMRSMEKSKTTTTPESVPVDARALLRQAKELYSAGRYEEAEKVAHQAELNGKHIRWGFFEDSPESVQNEIKKAKTKQNQEEAVRSLAEARKAFDMGNLVEAENLAHRAERLHGPYSLIEMNNSPQKLLAEIDAARLKAPSRTQPTAVAKSEPAKTQAQNPSVAMNATFTTPTYPMPSTVLPTNTAPTMQPAAQTPVTSMQQTQTVPVMPVMAAPQVDAVKIKAQAMVAEARMLQQQGRLIEARAKAMECQQLHASYSANEDRPEMVLLALSALAQKKIESHMQQAGEYMAGMQVDPAKGKMAEQELQAARQTAVGFGLDTGMIDGKMLAISQAQGKQWSDPSPAGRAHVSSGSSVVQGFASAPKAAASGNHGLELIEKARMELRAGQTATARRLAEEAYNPQYGVQSEAMQVLRSIDAEEYNQKTLTASRTFDAAIAAYNRKEYPQASLMFKTIDPQMLPADKQQQMREIVMTAEMRPSGISQTGLRSPQMGDSSPAGTAKVSDMKPPQMTTSQMTTSQMTPSHMGTGREGELVTQYKAMQSIKFQEMRQEGMRTISEATKRFDAGETDRALEMLQDYLTSLRDASLDSEQTALLRRPVENRMQSLKIVKHQRDFEKVQASEKEAASQTRTRLVLAEEAKHKQMSELMKQYQTFFRDGKYKEAEACATRAHDLDPDDNASSAAIYQARAASAAAAYKGIKSSKEEMVLKALNDADNQGPALDASKPVLFDGNRTRETRDRKGYESLGIATLRTEKAREIQRKLDAPISGIDYKETPLRQILDDLGNWNGINIVPDKPALEEAGLSLEQPVTMKLEGVALKSALNLLLHQAHLTYQIKDEVLNITTEEHAKGKLAVRIHPVLDLVMPVENSPAIGASNVLKAVLEGKASPGDNNVSLKSSSTPWMTPNSLGGGQAGKIENNMQPGTQGNWTKETPTGQLQEVLMKLITNTISPNSWSAVGGPGTIEFFPLGSALVINQTPDIQEQVADLLQALRRLQDQEVSVEVRFITIAESFYERIGVDFNMNLLTNNTKYEPQLVSQQFKPFGFINSFRPNRFISGLTPAGTFTQDLNIPIKQSSFQMAVPPFGEFPNSPPNGGLDLGLAFLSDIQVFLFLEAAQGDVRTNVMQAPKLTSFNGQTATITISDFQFYVTNVSVIQSGGQVVFVPTNTPVPTGVSLTINSVISADRRFVRMSLTPTLANLASANVPLFPITTFITPVFEGGAIGQPVPFTQFLQQPTVSTITLNTTVNVPDGGTVLLGGLKKLSEGRNEYGPPILSKLPYINRLFKNTAYGRETESLLIMVTPRIIINEEEELRQVPTAAAGPGNP